MLSVSYYKYQLLWKEIKSGKSIFQISHKSHSLFVSSQTLGKKTGNTFSKPHENLDLNVLSLSIIHSRQSVNKMMFDSDRKWKLFITTKLLQYIPDIREVGNDVPFLSLVVKKDLLDHSIMDHKIHFWLPNSFFIFVSVCIEMAK